MNQEPTKDHDGKADERSDWEEPEVRELSINETAVHPGVGADGETIWADCTRS